MKKVVDEGKLPLRVWMMLRESPDRLAVDMPNYRTINYGDKRFTVRGIKRAIDGALGSRGAWMLEPYADLASTSGMNTDTLDDIRRVAELCIQHEYQLAVHAIGDRGNRETLNIMEQTFAKHPEKNGKQLRWRIEHAQHLNAADIPRFGTLGVIASMEGVHATSDAVFVLARLGPKRAEEGAYVWQKLMKSGAIIANGTDAPVEDIDPIPSFYASVARKAHGRERVLSGSADVADGGAAQLHDQRRLRRLRGDDQRLVERRQAGRHHGALQGHHDHPGGSDPGDARGVHDRGRQGTVHERETLDRRPIAGEVRLKPDAPYDVH
jgi:predicted amidohydrolase YtcJ